MYRRRKVKEKSDTEVIVMTTTPHFPPGPHKNVIQALFTGGSPLASDRLEFLTSMNANYGDTVRYLFGKMNIFMFFNPEHVRDILVEHPDDFHKSILTHRILDRVM